jgi:hypothetical protein
MLNVEPKLTWPNMLNWLPQVAIVLTDRVLPRLRKSMMEVLEPNRAQLITLRVLPARKNDLRENVLPSHT